MKPQLLIAMISTAHRWKATRDFVDCTYAFDGVKCHMGHGDGSIIIVWHDDLSAEDALQRVRRCVTRSHVEHMYAMSIEGPMYARDDDDPVAGMVNLAWREWNEALN